jgi:hypothetical protein
MKSFRTILDGRFENRKLSEAIFEGKTSIEHINRKVNRIADKLIDQGENDNVTLGVAYHYKHYNWVPALMTNISKRKPGDKLKIPLFNETDSGMEIEDHLGDNDYIDQFRIYVLVGDKLPTTTYKTPQKAKAKFNRSIFDKKSKH